MGISGTAISKILREYEDKQLAAVREQRLRMQKIEENIPELSELNSHIAELSTDMAVMRIRGAGDQYDRVRKERSALIEKRNRLMQAAGLSPEDLKPRYECSLCNDTGYVENRMCRCMRDRVTEVLYDQSNIRKVLEKENFSTYSLKYYSNVPLEEAGGRSAAEIAGTAVSTAMDFVSCFGQKEENLFINGETGTGKTFLCNCIAKALLERGFGVIYLSAVKLFDTLAKAMFSNDPQDASRSDTIDSCDLLIIDDLGTEYSNSFTMVSFFNCINERLLKGRSTIISTNLPLERIRSDYSERVFSRIAEKYTLIKLFGDDIRIKKKLEE